MDQIREGRRHGRLAAAAGVLALAATGCGGGSGPVEVFSTGPADQACLVHQTHQPTTAYEGGESSTPDAELTFLRYYTAHGNQAFCDGKPATDRDRTWAQLYVRLTSNPANVGAILGTK